MPFMQPPLPTTPDQTRSWIPDGALQKSTTPVVEKWDPPDGTRPYKNGFWLSEFVLCFQRGFIPDGLLDEYFKLVSLAFHATLKSTVVDYRAFAFDFLVVVLDARDRLMSGCLIELRCAKHRVPYMYLSTLCTDPVYRGRGLAQQIVGAVYTLGSMMLRSASGSWAETLQSQRLFFGLTVQRTPGTQEHDSLVKLYSKCGLMPSRLDKPSSGFKSFTPYSIYTWDIDNQARHTAMWQEVFSYVHFQNRQVTIVSSSYTGPCTLLYFPFPRSFLANVRQAGIVQAKHADIFHATEIRPYYSDAVIFTTEEPKAPGGVFCIRAKSPACMEVTLHVSIPSAFAFRIFTKP